MSEGAQQSTPPIPHYLRQRLLLVLLEEVSGVCGKMELQKLLFLAHGESDLAYFDFIPYRYGCYSFQAAEDLNLLEKRGWLTSNERQVSLRCRLPKESSIPQHECEGVREVMRRYKDMHSDNLVRYVYEQYPYYAINSEMAPRLLDKFHMDRVRNALDVARIADDLILFTIGYEGVSLESYINKLIQAGVTLLCDVRRNPLSRKFGFSKGTLASKLPRIGIGYHHIPELGIDSDKRQSLKTMADYERLFMSYRRTLPKRETAIVKIFHLLEKHKRIALTCYEKEPHCCHRHCVSDYLAASHNIEVKHL